MIAEVSPVKPSEAHLVWPLLTEIAIKELGFPEEALQHYRLTLTDEEILRWAQSQKHVLIAARKDGKLIGVLIGAPPEGGIGTILWLLVTTKYRGEGIGARIFEESCKLYKAMGCHKIKLAAPTNDAVMFYEKQGMAVEGFHPNHWWNLDFWSMGKNL